MSPTNPKAILGEFEADEVELAGQLLGLRQNPGAELRRRIEAIPTRPARPAGFVPRLVWSLTALVLVLLLFISPPAQATLGRFEAVIGRIHLTVLDVLPARPNPVLIESTPVSLAAAQTEVPFNFAGPTRLPAGLVDDPQIFVTRLEIPIVKMRWRDVAGGFVQLSIHPANGAAGSMTQNLIGAESSDTITINGQESVIIYGGWDEASRTWDRETQLVTLIWELNDIQYNLLAYSEAVSLTDLIAMAESVR